jgi:hypothetical protein
MAKNSSKKKNKTARTGFSIRKLFSSRSHASKGPKTPVVRSAAADTAWLYISLSGLVLFIGIAAMGWLFYEQISNGGLQFVSTPDRNIEQETMELLVVRLDEEGIHRIVSSEESKLQNTQDIIAEDGALFTPHVMPISEPEVIPSVVQDGE